MGLSLATFLIVLDYTIANVSIPYIAGDLSVSTSQGTYVITSFSVGNAIVLPITGWLTKRIGSIRLLIASILLFIFFSWMCGSSPNFVTLLFARFMQGFVSGPLIPLSQSLIVSTNPPEKKNTVVAFWSMVLIVAPVIGPVLGGWISFDYNWSWIFYINIPFGLISAFLVWYTLRDFENKTEKVSIDYIGFFLLAVFVGCLQIVVDKGEQYDWLESTYILSLSITSAVAFCYFLVWEYLHPRPIIDLSLFKIRTYSISVAFIGIMYAMYFGSVVLIPLWLQVNLGYNAIWAGIAVAPIGIAPLLLSIWSGKLVAKYGALRPLVICCLLFSLSCFYTSYFTTAVDLQHIWLSRILLGFGLVFFITPLFSLSVEEIPNERLPQSTGMFHFVRTMTGGIGTSVFNTLWTRRTAYHHERLGSVITPFSDNTNIFLQDMEKLGITGDKAIGITNELVDSQTAMLGLNDCFYAMGWIFLALICILPVGRKKEKGKSPFLHNR